MKKIVTTFLSLTLLILSISHGQQVPVAATQIKRPKVEVFDIGERKAYIQPAPEFAVGKPWVWYGPNVKGNFILLRLNKYAEPFLAAGISLASCDLGEVRGAPSSTAKFHQFYEEMVKRGYSKKPILLGQSRGGIMTLAWAVKHPDKVKAWAGIYPVCSLASYPLRFSIDETLKDYGMSEAEIRAKLSELDPIENLSLLAKHKVPMFTVHGDKDATVPYQENSLRLHDSYKALGGSCQLITVPNRGHDFSAPFFENPELINFVLGQIKK